MSKPRVLVLFDTDTDPPANQDYSRFLGEDAKEVEYEVATTLTRACSARRRCSSSQSGKYEPDRSFGIANSIVPARVSHSRYR